jgi:hypothetical protein
VKEQFAISRGQPRRPEDPGLSFRPGPDACAPDDDTPGVGVDERARPRLIGADMKTRSAHSRSDESKGAILRSASFLSQSDGNMADMMSSPSGGNIAFFEINSRANLKLQKVVGYKGYTNKIFINQLNN